MAKATRESFGDAILAIGDTNPNLVVLDADLSKSTMTQAFMKKFPVPACKARFFLKMKTSMPEAWIPSM